jgi:non-ribosomal peptide synthetase component F
VRLLIIGGERAIPDRLATWQQKVGQRIRLFNTYGPTETTVVATSWEASQPISPDPLLREVPIGRPVQNVRTYVLDDRFRPVPHGVPGQLFVAGEGLAVGYLNRPKLTATHFIPHPLGCKEGGERLYGTGDLARYLPDGNLEFLGRVDHQVKVRGYRIELWLRHRGGILLSAMS